MNERLKLITHSDYFCLINLVWKSLIKIHGREYELDQHGESKINVDNTS